jgi:hypothetical protein
MGRPAHPAPPNLPTLRVLRNHGLVPDFELLESRPPQRGWIGVERNHAEQRLDHVDVVVEKTWRKEYVMALAEGHLLAADEATAREAAKWAGKPADFARYLAPAEKLQAVKDVLDAAAKSDAKNVADAMAAKSRAPSGGVSGAAIVEAVAAIGEPAKK